MADITRVPYITVATAPPLNPLVGDEWWNPVNGQLFVWYNDGSSLQWVVANRYAPSGGVGGASVTTGDTPPASPSDGDLWWDSALGKLFVRYDDANSSQWVPASPVGSNQPISPQAVAINSGALVLDLNVSNFFLVMVNANITAISLVHALPGSTLTLQFTANGTSYAQTWPWTWLTGMPVLSTAAGKRDLVTVWTVDGVEMFASMVAQAY